MKSSETGQTEAVKAWKPTLDLSEVSLSSNTSSVIGAEGGHFWSHRGCGDLVGWKMLEELFSDMFTSLCPETDGEMRTTDCFFGEELDIASQIFPSKWHDYQIVQIESKILQMWQAGSFVLMPVASGMDCYPFRVLSLSCFSWGLMISMIP